MTRHRSGDVDERERRGQTAEGHGGLDYGGTVGRGGDNWRRARGPSIYGGAEEREGAGLGRRRHIHGGARQEPFPSLVCVSWGIGGNETGADWFVDFA